MSRRLPGLLVLMFLLFGLFYARSAWAESDGVHSAGVLVRVSPLTLLVNNDVTVKVGEFTCQLVNFGDVSSVCLDLPPGDYQVHAYSEGYMVWPPSYQITIPGEPEDSNDDGDDEDDEDDEDTAYFAGNSPNAASQEQEPGFYFKFYEINHQVYMPDLQVAE